jgi:hypothetical protein
MRLFSGICCQCDRRRSPPLSCTSIWQTRGSSTVRLLSCPKNRPQGRSSPDPSRATIPAWLNAVESFHIRVEVQGRCVGQPSDETRSTSCQATTASQTVPGPERHSEQPIVSETSRSTEASPLSCLLAVINVGSLQPSIELLRPSWQVPEVGFPGRTPCGLSDRRYRWTTGPLAEVGPCTSGVLVLSGDLVRRCFKTSTSPLKNTQYSHMVLPNDCFERPNMFF